MIGIGEKLLKNPLSFLAVHKKGWKSNFLEQNTNFFVNDACFARKHFWAYSKHVGTPCICSFNNGTSITILLYILTLLLGTLNVGIIGYNFGYYKGSYRTSLFHSELTFLVVFAIAFVMNLISLVIKLFTKVRKFMI